MQNVIIGIATIFRNGKPLRFVFQGFCDPLPIGIGFGTGLGSPKGHAWVTPGPPKHHARVTLGSN